MLHILSITALKCVTITVFSSICTANFRICDALLL